MRVKAVMSLCFADVTAEMHTLYGVHACYGCDISLFCRCNGRNAHHRPPQTCGWERDENDVAAAVPAAVLHLRVPGGGRGHQQQASQPR